MNVFGKRARGWRKGKKRGVSPIIATILLVAITVVLAAVLYVLISGLTGHGNATPIGTAFGFGTANQQTGTASTAAYCATGDQCWEVAIASASGPTVSETQFLVKTSGGAAAPVTVIIHVVTLAQTGWINQTNGNTAWSVSAKSTGITTSTTLAPTMEIWVDTGVPTATSTLGFGTGDTLTVYGSGSFSGSASTNLP